MKSHTSIEYPIRINRYLHLKGYCSRRKADKLIEEGKIKINNKKAVLGQKVTEADTVSVDSSVARLPSQYRYFICNKPAGVVSHNPQQGEQSIEDISGLGKDFFPVGRLDKASTGLMLLTNDGRIVNALLNPQFGHEREYFVVVDKPLKTRAIKQMENGVDIEGYITKPAHVTQTSDTSFFLTLTEGKKHQIRRMAASLGYQVKKLQRVRMMHIELDTLPESHTRELTTEERLELLKKVSLA